MYLTNKKTVARSQTQLPKVTLEGSISLHCPNAFFKIKNALKMHPETVFLKRKMCNCERVQIWYCYLTIMLKIWLL